MFPQSIAGVSAYMVLVATNAWRYGMLSAGNGERKCMVKCVLIGVRTN